METLKAILDMLLLTYIFLYADNILQCLGGYMTLHTIDLKISDDIQDAA